MKFQKIVSLPITSWASSKPLDTAQNLMNLLSYSIITAVMKQFKSHVFIPLIRYEFVYRFGVINITYIPVSRYHHGHLNLFMLDLGVQVQPGSLLLTFPLLRFLLPTNY